VEFVLLMLLLTGTVALITAPLRRRPSPLEAKAAEVTALEAAKASKLGEIRDAELDFRTGKLSPQDYEAVDRQLRAEAAGLLHRLDAAWDGDGEAANR
jgi:hypothetical protein